MICPNCGYSYKDGLLICEACGIELPKKVPWTEKGLSLDGNIQQFQHVGRVGFRHKKRKDVSRKVRN
jgi:hypothetical protein